MTPAPTSPRSTGPEIDQSARAAVSAPLQVLLALALCLSTTPGTAQVVPPVGDNLEIAGVDGLPLPDLSLGLVSTALEIPGAAVQPYAFAWLGHQTGAPGTTDLRIKVLNNDGTTRIAETILDSIVDGDGDLSGISRPALAADGEGNFMVVWLRSDGATAELRAKVFRPISDGAFGPVVIPASVSAPPPGSGHHVLLESNTDAELAATGLVNIVPDLDLGAFGAMALSWSNPNTGPDTGLYFQLFDLDIDGVPPATQTSTITPRMAPTLVSSALQRHDNGRVAINSNTEESVVVWRRVEGEIQAQRFSATGARVGNPLSVAARPENTLSSNHDPEVAWDLQDTFWVVWEHSSYQAAFGGSGWSSTDQQVLVSRFGRDGSVHLDALEAEIPPATITQPKRRPRIVTSSSAGDVALAWETTLQSCQLIQGGVVANMLFSGSCLGVTHPSSATSCTVAVTINPLNGLSYDHCRWNAQLDDDPQTPSTNNSWAKFANNSIRSGTGSGLVSFTLGTNAGATQQNRCVVLTILGRQFRIEQACNGGGCIPCASQLGDGSELRLETPSTSLAEDLALLGADKGGIPATTDVYARWLDSTFLADAATPTGQFQVNSYSVGVQGPVAIAQQRDGDFLVGWEGETAGAASGLAIQRYATPVELVVNDVGILEGPFSFKATAAFTVTASKAHPTDGVFPSVEVLTIDDSATVAEPNPDYSRVSQVLSFEPGSLAQAVLVNVQDDEVFEDTEQFFLDLFNETDALLIKNRGIGVIIDNDDPEEVSFKPADRNVSVCEDGSDASGGCLPPLAGTPASVTLEVSLARAQEVDGTVQFQTVAGPLPDGAAAGEDYEPVVGEVQFLAGTTTGFITIELNDDILAENDEVFYVDLFDPQDLSLGFARASVTIVNDDTCLAIPSAQAPPDGDPNTDDGIPPAMSVSGGTGYLCVVNTASCPWSAAIEPDPNDPSPGWLQLLAVEQQDPPLGHPCQDYDGGGVEPAIDFGGWIHYQVDPNTGANGRNSTIEVAEEPIPISQEGGACNLIATPSSLFFYPVAEDLTGTIAVSYPSPPDDPTLCSTAFWNASESANWIVDLEGEAGTSGTGAGTVTFTVLPNLTTTTRSDVVVIQGTQVTVVQEGIFEDHFDVGSSPPGWALSGSGVWSQAGTHLTGAAPSTFETAIAAPFPGCISCDLEADVRFDQFGKGTATVFGWYRNSQNHIALTVDEFLDRWILTQRAGGVDTVIVDLERDVLVGQSYPIAMGFDGSVLTLTIAGDEVCPPAISGSSLLCPPALPLADGTVGFGVGSAVASFDRIRVVRSDGPVPVFADGFESGNTAAWSTSAP